MRSSPNLRDRWLWVTLILLLLTGAAGVVIRPEISEPAQQGLRTLGALLLVVGLAFVGAFFFKRWAPIIGHVGPESGVGIRTLGTRELGAGRSILVVEVEKEHFLLGACRDSIVCLARLEGKGGKSQVSETGDSP